MKQLMSTHAGAFITFYAAATAVCAAWRIVVPQEPVVALHGDVAVAVAGDGFPPPLDARLQLLQMASEVSNGSVLLRPLGAVAVRPVNATSWEAVLPCGMLAQGGHFTVRVLASSSPNADPTTSSRRDVLKPLQALQADAQLDVQWPEVRLQLTPQRLETFPEAAVTASVDFPAAQCALAAGATRPELWLELLFCGDTQKPDCTSSANNKVLYAEQLSEYPRARHTKLHCGLFGQAGFYALVVREGSPVARSLIHSVTHAAFLKATWSDKFVFNVHARSIFPCDALGGGVAVLFQYPGCILARGDRVRVFARLRADVASLAPPSALVYVAERRIARGQHALRFDCDLFSERFVEYCFSYVSQAVTGAVSDVRVDCVPTLPVRDNEAGGWGPWTAWTACSSSCGGGTRSRYRVCDSPPPRYGAKFCEGASLETQACGRGSGAWDCPLGIPARAAGGAPLLAERPEVAAEVGPGCRCGCAVHLGHAKPRRLLAASALACPGRALWLVQAESGHAVRLVVRRLLLPCAAQWLRVRDGSALSAQLMAQRVGPDVAPAPGAVPAPPPPLRSTGRELLLEFGTDVDPHDCTAEFIAHAIQITLHGKMAPGGNDETQVAIIGSEEERQVVVTGVHLTLALFAALVACGAAALALHLVHRYRKYQLTASRDFDTDSDRHSGSLLSAASRAASSVTLLSEIISLRRLGLRRPGTTTTHHHRLRDMDDAYLESAASEERSLLGERAPQRPDSLPATTAAALSSLPCTPPPSPRAGARPRSAPIDRLRSSSVSPPPAPPPPPPTTSATAAAAEEEQQQSHASRRHHQGGSSSSERKFRRVSRPPEPGGEDGYLASSVVAARRSIGHTVRTFSRGSPSIASLNGHTTPSFNSLLRSNISKDHKDKRNMERLLAGSEFSLAGPDHDLELDYYDYNVYNAGAVPGSYLGMDPAYLVWIPPFAPGYWEEESDNLLLKGDHIISAELASQESLREYNISTPQITEFVPPSQVGNESLIVLKSENDKINKLNSNEDSTKINKASHMLQRHRNSENLEAENSMDPLKNLNNSETALLTTERIGNTEKEIIVEKSPSDHNSDFCDILDTEDEIKFADDDDESNDCDKIAISKPSKVCNVKV